MTMAGSQTQRSDSADGGSLQDPATKGRTAASQAVGRSRLRGLLMLGGVALVVVGGGVSWLRGGRWVSTDNAYVRARKLMVTTDVSGLVASVDVHEGDTVKPGQVLFRLDPKQFDIAIRVAQANLEQTRITLEAAQQDYGRLQSDIAGQEAQVGLAQANFERAAALALSNAGTRTAYDQAHFGLEAAQQQLEALRRQAHSALIRLGGKADAPVEQHPQYLAAKAQVDEAQRQLDHATVRAPFAGVVTAVESLQPGTFLVSQTAALTNTGAVGLVATQNLWVDANVKETDLTFAGPGDAVDVTIDAYPGRVWRGRVDSIAPASGAEFSILPAQNASGNWVKVVQRVPVRIALEPQEGAPALRAGMSAVADIDTGHKRAISELWGAAAPQAAGGINVSSNDQR